MRCGDYHHQKVWHGTLPETIHLFNFPLPITIQCKKWSNSWIFCIHCQDGFEKKGKHKQTKQELCPCPFVILWGGKKHTHLFIVPNHGGGGGTHLSIVLCSSLLIPLTLTVDASHCLVVLVYIHVKSFIIGVPFRAQNIQYFNQCLFFLPFIFVIIISELYPWSTK